MTSSARNESQIETHFDSICIFNGYMVLCAILPVPCGMDCRYKRGGNISKDVPSLLCSCRTIDFFYVHGIISATKSGVSVVI